MKNRNKILSIILSLALVGATSCDFGDTNIDPDNPTNAPIESLLPSVMGHMAYLSGGDASRYAGIFTQHFTGVANQHFNFTQYQFFNKDVVNLWRNLYEDALPDLEIIIERADANQSPHYAGVARVMKAMWLGTATDLFGDTPYNEANEGAANLAPLFDDQQALYTEIQLLLSDGITNLQAASSVKAPGGEDYYYGGDLVQWIKFARLLQARYYIHQIKKDEAGASTNALNAITAGTFTAVADDADFAFAAGEGNPLSQFNAQRAGDMLMGEFFVEMMKTKADPRLPFFVAPDGNGNFTGSPIDVNSINAAASQVGPYYSAAANPITMASYAEAKFIEAEARVRISGANDATADAAFREAITASLTKVGVDPVDITTYLVGKNLSGTKDDNIRQIIEEKYVALFNSFETWTDYRRTGYPVLAGATGDATLIPRRFPYSQESIDFNSNTPSVGLTDRMWWDQ